MKVMISSTLRDLAKERDRLKMHLEGLGLQVDVCERWLPSIDTTLERSIDAAKSCDLFVLVIGDTYGTIPNGHERSFTELEFQTARDAEKPILVFVKSISPPSADASEEDIKNWRMRQDFVGRVSQGHRHRAAFSDVVDLFSMVSNAINQVLPRFKKVPLEDRTNRNPKVLHEYSLLQTELFGREKFLSELDAWATSESPIAVIEDIGGMGKSALAYTWWQRQFPKANPTQAWTGGLWYSFYAEDTNYTDWLRQVHVYAYGGSLDGLTHKKLNELEAEVREVLESKRLLIALDGFETELEAYSRLAANDDKASLENASTTGYDDAEDRRMQNSLFSRFLRKLVSDARSQSRLVLTTRLFPLDLEGSTPRMAMPGVKRWEVLGGIDLSAAQRYWQACGLNPLDPDLPAFVERIGGYPLALTLMGAMMKRKEVATLADFRERDPQFDVLSKGVTRDAARSDVFASALNLLTERERYVLLRIAARRKPVEQKLLLVILGKGPSRRRGETPNSSKWDFVEPLDSDNLTSDGGGMTEDEAQDILIRLQNLHLVSWDAATRTYDMHPVVRGLVRGRVEADELRGAQSDVLSQLQTVPKPYKIERVRDLNLFLESYHAYIDMEDYRGAAYYLTYGLKTGLDDLGVTRLLREVLDCLFEINKASSPPQVRFRWMHDWGDPSWRAAMSDFAQALARCYEAEGHWEVALALHGVHSEAGVCKEVLCETSVSNVLRALGRFREAEDVHAKCCRNLVRLKPDEAARPDRADDYGSDTSTEHIMNVAWHRLASVQVDRANEAKRPGEFRLAFLRRDAIIRQVGLHEVMNDRTPNEYARDRCLDLASLASLEGKHQTAVAIAEAVYRDAEEESNAADRDRALLKIAEAQENLGNFQAARENYTKYLQSIYKAQDDPVSASARLGLARCAIALDEAKEAERALRTVERLAGVWRDVRIQARVCLIWADLHAKIKDREAETKALESVIAIFSEQPKTPINEPYLSDALKRLRKLRISPRVRRQIAKLGPPRIDSWWVINPWNRYHTWATGASLSLTPDLRPKHLFEAPNRRPQRRRRR